MDRKNNLPQNSLPLVVVAGAMLAVLVTGCSSYTEPEWTSVAKVEGKSYVTDGNMAIDMQLIQVSQPPVTQSAAGWFSESIFQNMRAEKKELFTIDDVKESGGDSAVVVGPGDLQLPETYVSFLKGKLSGHTIGFWQSSATEPIVIVVDGKPVGAMKVIGP